ncbi:hypothetical protein [Qingshengfaniella alkalisoli]|uniref:Uncharacterized protein n=1 Tax=Qingshengfaniella alkalisoli TaxID=2599296 RepID=A0A5B8IWY1_9RHOB|nr:hypothetical protein [Qingshengfaniella alkalisoli]QDY69068.1 hypothetical protein FPZ52_05100 [Qingshengfaniella alkalisoli]
MNLESLFAYICALTAALAASGAMAADAPPIQLSCSFETECFEDEDCAESTFSLSLTGEVGITDAQLLSDSETITGSLAATPAGGLAFLGITGPAVHLLSKGEDFTARYTVHLTNGPMVISYLGRCEAE